jgi:hypothetical protein
LNVIVVKVIILKSEQVSELSADELLSHRLAITGSMKISHSCLLLKPVCFTHNCRTFFIMLSRIKLIKITTSESVNVALFICHLTFYLSPYQMYEVIFEIIWQQSHDSMTMIVSCDMKSPYCKIFGFVNCTKPAVQHHYIGLTGIQSNSNEHYSSLSQFSEYFFHQGWFKNWKKKVFKIIDTVIIRNWEFFSAKRSNFYSLVKPVSDDPPWHIITLLPFLIGTFTPRL